MSRSILISVFLVLAASAARPRTAYGQTDVTAEEARIKKPALDYIEGWYTGNADRMESALHPELAKRMIYTDPRTGKSVFNHQGAMTLVEHTRSGLGAKIPKERSRVTTFARKHNMRDTSHA